MRLRLAVTTKASEVPWRSVLAPGRSLAYDSLARSAPALGQRLHDNGFGPHGMVPFGHGAPLFASAPRSRARYSAGGTGTVEFGSPVPEVVDAFARGLREREVLDWGGVALRMVGIDVVDPPAFAAGRAIMRTATPVVMKGSGYDESGQRRTRQDWLLPGEPQWAEYFQQNLRRKAETLEIDPDIRLESVRWIGPKRSFVVGEGAKPGAAVEVELAGSPATLQALWSWGLGQANAAGFGWVSP